MPTSPGALGRLGFLADPVIAAPYLGELPLWPSILAESELGQGCKLGPAGSRIVAEVIGGLLTADNKSYVKRTLDPARLQLYGAGFAAGRWRDPIRTLSGDCRL